MTGTAYIDPTFRRVVEAHLAGNLVVARTHSPLILGIFGPSGEGKTFQVDQVCTDLGLTTTLISPGELESENAGHPGHILRKEYLAIGMGASRGVLIVNDIDTVLGNWGSLVQYTVNRQVVFGQLMALCDYPNDVAGTRCKRVPIILTGNNPSILYGPLLRPGRTRVFGWAPSVDARISIVHGIFPELRPDDVAKLVRGMPEQPVSFWVDVRAAVWETVLGDWIGRDGRTALKNMLAMGQTMNPAQDPYTYESVARMANELQMADVRQASFVQSI